MTFMTPHDRERDLIAQARNGTERAYRALFDAHVESLFRFLRQFTPDRSETEDWVQRAFIKAFGGLDGFDGRSRFSTWLFRIGLNEMRMDRRTSRPDTRDIAAGDSLSSAESRDIPDEFMWEHTMHQWLRQLGTIQQSVFILHEVEGFSHAEIAGMLDISESHSRTLLTRARKHLRHEWKKTRNA